MRSLAVTVVVNLVLSSSSAVVGLPHVHDFEFQDSLVTRPTDQQGRHSRLRGRLIGSAPQSLFFKRGEESASKKTQSWNGQDYGHQDHDKDIGGYQYDDDDPCEDETEDSSYSTRRSNPDSHPSFKSPKTQSTSSQSSYYSSYSSSESSWRSSNVANGSTQSSSYESGKKQKHTDSQKYDASSDKYATHGGNSSGHQDYGSYAGYQGKATFFSQGGVAGACGKVHEDSDFVVAIQSQLYDGGKFCGKTVMVTRKLTGKSIKCIAADECPGCPTGQSLDLSVGAFNALGSPDEGIFDIHWQVVDE